MERPDEKGFVQVNWPSKSIPHGGILHTKVIEPSTEQQRFLKVLLEESKLTISQRRKGAYVLRQYDEVARTERSEKQPVVRPRTSRRRSLSAIRESGIYIVDEYRPVKRGEDREKLKENLVYQMAYGDKEQRSEPRPPPRPKHQTRLPTKKEQWNDLVTQIRERADWLAEMEYLGQGAQYRDLVNGQIAERMRALDALGIDSECSTARTTSSSSSTPQPTSKLSVKSTVSAAGLRQSRKSTRSYRLPSKGLFREENVADYEKLTPIQYSPRRRV
ncbi:UPF0193 protein EVG1 homolog [Aricia agestis]|uniref:UPF0193 protein EVG1 homolog n=1 Tax=Aricia agestis TaxID=91739 RepID=UPI001C20A94C|nr:UPF0193 protein EVG1 homolog [Aricia agestis]